MTEDEINKLINEPFEEAPVEEQPIPEGAGPTSYFRQTFPDDIPEEDLKRQYKEFAENIEGSPDKGTGLTPQSEIDADARPPYQPVTPTKQYQIDLESRQSQLTEKFMKGEAAKPQEAFAESISTSETDDELSFGESVHLAFLVDNPVYAVYDNLRSNIRDHSIPISERNQILQSFDPTPYIPEAYRERFGDEYVGLVTEKEIDAMTALIQRREGYRTRAQQAGMLQQLGAGVVGSVADPTILLPGGVVVRAGKSVSVGKSVVSGATAATAGIAVSEGVMHAADPTRTKSETAMSVGAGVILGGALTGGVAARAAGIGPTNREIVRGAQNLAPAVTAKQKKNKQLNQLGRAMSDELDELDPKDIPDDLMNVPPQWENVKRVGNQPKLPGTMLSDDLANLTTPTRKRIDDLLARGTEADDTLNAISKAVDESEELQEIMLHTVGKNDFETITRRDLESLLEDLDVDDFKVPREMIQAVLARADESDDFTTLRDIVDDMIDEAEEVDIPRELQIEGKDYLYGENEILTGSDFQNQTGHISTTANGTKIEDFLQTKTESAPQAGDTPPSTPTARDSAPQATDAPLSTPPPPVARPSVPDSHLETVASRRIDQDADSKLIGANQARNLTKPEKLKARVAKAGGRVARIPEQLLDNMKNSLPGKIGMRLDGSNAYRVFNAHGVESAIGATERLSWWFNRANKTHREIKDDLLPKWLAAQNKQKGMLGDLEWQKGNLTPNMDKHYRLFLHEIGKAIELQNAGQEITDPILAQAVTKYKNFTDNVVNNAVSSSDRRSGEFNIPRESTEGNGHNGIVWQRDHSFLHRTWNLETIFSEPTKFKALIKKALDKEEDAFRARGRHRGIDPDSAIGKLLTRRGLDLSEVSRLDTDRIANEFMQRIQERSLATHNTVSRDINRLGTSMEESLTLRIPFSSELEEFMILDPKVRSDFFLRRVGRHKEYREMLASFGPEVKNWQSLMDILAKSYDAMALDENIPKRIRKKKKYRDELMKEQVQATKLLTAMKDDIFQHKAVNRDAITLIGYNLRKTITMAALGKLVVTSIPDIPRMVGEAGFGPAIKAARAQFNGTLRQMNREDLEDFGIVVEYLNNKRINHYTGAEDVYDEIQLLGGITSRIDKAHKNFFILNASSMWNQNNKEMAVAAVQHKLLKALGAVPKTRKKLDLDKMNKRDVAEFARWGIGIDQLQALQVQISNHGGIDPQTGLWKSNFANWSNSDLQRQYVAMLTRIADNVINTPSVRTNPRWFTNPFGAMIGQFTSFHYASHMQTAVPFMQDPNWTRMSATAMAAGLGYVSYQSKYFLNHDEFDEDANAIYEGMAQSGTFALAFYAIELQDKAAREWSIDNVMTGKDESNWIAKREMTNALGPWVNTAATGRDAYMYLMDGQNGKAAQAAKFITPYGNLPYYKLPHLFGVSDSVSSAVPSIDDYRPKSRRKKTSKYVPMDNL